MTGPWNSRTSQGWSALSKALPDRSYNLCQHLGCSCSPHKFCGFELRAFDVWDTVLLSMAPLFPLSTHTNFLQHHDDVKLGVLSTVSRRYFPWWSKASTWLQICSVGSGRDQNVRINFLIGLLCLVLLLATDSWCTKSWQSITSCPGVGPRGCQALLLGTTPWLSWGTEHQARSLPPPRTGKEPLVAGDSKVQD